MGKWDENIAKSRQMLADAEKKYSDAVLSMADAAPHVREHVLDFYRAEIAEANQMIEIFTSDND